MQASKKIEKTPKKRKEIIRTKTPTIRLSDDEFKIISEKAAAHGLTFSRYLRDLAMNYPITCIADLKVANDFLKTSGDLGRLGGLFKKWLVANDENKAALLGSRDFKNIDDLVEGILADQQKLKELAMQIIKKDGRDS